MAKKSRQWLAAERKKRLRAAADVKVAAFTLALQGLLKEHGVRVSATLDTDPWFYFIGDDYGMLVIDDDLNPEGDE